MARSLSNMVLNGISRSTHSFRSRVMLEVALQLIIQAQITELARVFPTCQLVEVALGSIFPQGVKYSTKITDDSDTHEDFRPTKSHESSGIFVQDIIKQDVKENPVMIYMKGVPDAPQCGFSALAVKILQLYGVPISARNILENPELKEAIKAVSNWPTFPQIFVKGEFIGGSDIVHDMHKSGELKELLTDIKHANSES